MVFPLCGCHVAHTVRTRFRRRGDRSPVTTMNRLRSIVTCTAVLNRELIVVLECTCCLMAARFSRSQYIPSIGCTYSSTYTYYIHHRQHFAVWLCSLECPRSICEYLLPTCLPFNIVSRALSERKRVGGSRHWQQHRARSIDRMLQHGSVRPDHGSLLLSVRLHG